MTEITREQMIEWLNKRDAMPLCSHGGEFNEAIKNREMLKAIRTALTAQSANTLPLDEIPRGWELAWISHGDFAEGKTFCAQIRRIVLPTVRFAYGITAAEALRAAIVKVTP